MSIDKRDYFAFYIYRIGHIVMPSNHPETRHG
jgi:hypothetical protein